MSRIQNPAPDATRRRASTNRKMETIMRLARRLPLTRQVLADQLETATPSQMEFMDQWMNAEIESRERSKRSRLLKQAGFPAVKTLDGYDWENIRFRWIGAGGRLNHWSSRAVRRMWSCSDLPARAKPIWRWRWEGRPAWKA